MHQRDRIPLEQPRQLALEGPEAAGVDFDDAAAGDHVGDEAVDGLLGRAAGDGVARLQDPVQRLFVELADGRRAGQGPFGTAAHTPARGGDRSCYLQGSAPGATG